jgi:hypothetical protein
LANDFLFLALAHKKGSKDIFSSTPQYKDKEGKMKPFDLLRYRRSMSEDGELTSRQVR